jgi:hypothetical protein
MWQVFDCGKPADSAHQSSLKSGYGWDNSVFPSFAEAEKYARSYLGYYCDPSVSLLPNVPFEYNSGEGDVDSCFILIKEIGKESHAS